MIRHNNKLIKIMTAIIVILFACYAVYHLCRIGEKKFLELVERSADEEREKRHAETSVKKEIHTDYSDVFVIDMYMDPFTIENMMDVYQKADEDECMLIEGSYGVQKGQSFESADFDFRFFEDNENNIEGYFIMDKPYVLYKNKEEVLYKPAFLGNVNSIEDKNNLQYLLPFIYDYMIMLKPASTKHIVMKFLAANKYEYGINVMKKWAQGMFEEKEQQYSEEEKEKLIEYSREVLEFYGVDYH